MAGHSPIKIDMLHLALLDEAKKVLKDRSDFDKITLPTFKSYRAMSLPVDDYNMNDETGLTDSRVLSVSDREKSFEFHLDHDSNINILYLVM